MLASVKSVAKPQRRRTSAHGKACSILTVVPADRRTPVKAKRSIAVVAPTARPRASGVVEEDRLVRWQQLPSTNPSAGRRAKPTIFESKPRSTGCWANCADHGVTEAELKRAVSCIADYICENDDQASLAAAARSRSGEVVTQVVARALSNAANDIKPRPRCAPFGDRLSAFSGRERRAVLVRPRKRSCLCRYRRFPGALPRASSHRRGTLYG